MTKKREKKTKVFIECLEKGNMSKRVKEKMKTYNKKEREGKKGC